MSTQLKPRQLKKPQQANPYKLDHGLICRPDFGGCGRPMVIVETPIERAAFGVLSYSRPRTVTVAVHAEELNERPVARASYAMAVRRRRDLEAKCAGRKERGELC